MFNLKTTPKRGFINPATASGTVAADVTHVHAEGDRYNLQRFVDAQTPVIEEAYSELRRGRKNGLWMQFVFPQLRDPGDSQAASKFSISSLEEAAAYLKHPILGRRLRLCCLIMTLVKGRSIDQIFGHPDDLRFRSSMILFAHATALNQIFDEVLRQYFGCKSDSMAREHFSLLQAGEQQNEQDLALTT